VPKYSLVFPEGFDDYAWEVQAKGWFADAMLLSLGRQYRINFYDPVRLGQEIESEHKRGGVFFEQNLVVVQSVTRPNMEKAMNFLMESGQASSLIAEQMPQDGQEV